MWTKIEGFPRGMSSFRGQTNLFQFPFKLHWRFLSTSNFHCLCHFQACIPNTATSEIYKSRMSCVAGSVNNVRKRFLPSGVARAFGWSSYMTQLPVDDLYHRHLPKYLAPSLEKGTDILWGPVGTPKFHFEEKYQLCQLCWIYGYVIPKICGKVSQANLDKT